MCENIEYPGPMRLVVVYNTPRPCAVQVWRAKGLGIRGRRLGIGVRGLQHRTPVRGAGPYLPISPCVSPHLPVSPLYLQAELHALRELNGVSVQAHDMRGSSSKVGAPP